ncbi:hypothetical protein [Meridianimarinicoccus marinus]|uniref:hypothetical protein n=1 Tax=Meridianimarinicoccus marinus TaxID=3231483 RepID=UPI00344B2636
MPRPARTLCALHGYLASRRARRLNNHPPGAVNVFAEYCSTRRRSDDPAPQGNPT